MTSEINTHTDSSDLKVIAKVNSAENLISGFHAENRIFFVNLQKLVQERKDIQQIQKQISKSYENIYNEINNARTDSIQFIIYEDLIAKHRKLKLERK